MKLYAVRNAAGEWFEEYHHVQDWTPILGDADVFDEKEAAESVALEVGGTVVEFVSSSEVADLKRVNAILEEHVDDARSEQYKADEEVAVLRRALESTVFKLCRHRLRSDDMGPTTVSCRVEKAIAQARKEVSDEQT